ncbi:MAG: biotin/lipoyl-containing protein, partial [Aggregatilineales bacterium]
MAKEIIMPKFGFTQEESTIVAWLKQEGDRVEKGEPIAECTTDKVNMEIEAPEDGILGGIRYPAGATVPVTEIIAYVLQEGETLPEASAAAAPAAPAAEAVPAAPPRDDADAGEAGATPLARRIAEAEGVDLSAVVGTGAGGK